MVGSLGWVTGVVVWCDWVGGEEVGEEGGLGVVVGVVGVCWTGGDWDVGGDWDGDWQGRWGG